MNLQLVECPRDAMQGWPVAIPTMQKIEYLNALLQVGFDTIDFGSFVSARAVPQMADTAEVLDGLSLENCASKLLAIVANLRGAEEAAGRPEINCLGYPYSVSPVFQFRNTNRQPSEAMNDLRQIAALSESHGKELVVYLSMAFGNPYGDPYDEESVISCAREITGMGIETISLADTVGLAEADHVFRLCSRVLESLPETRVGVHLHAALSQSREKIDAAYRAGIRRFDSALLGIGGCPMSGTDLIGNLDTQLLVNFLSDHKVPMSLNLEALARCAEMARTVFSQPVKHSPSAF